MFNTKTVSIEWGGQTLTLETGKVARQADGAVMASLGETVVLCAVTAAKSVKDGQDFFPLTVEFQEKTYAAGKIPGGYFKREGKLSENEILTSRLIDRPIRPLFPEGFMNEVQVIATVISADKDNDPDTLGLVGASSALMISDIPIIALKFKNFSWKDNKFRYLLVGKSLIIILVFQLWAIPIIVILYLILSIIDNYTTKKYEVQS